MVGILHADNQNEKKNIIPTRKLFFLLLFITHCCNTCSSDIGKKIKNNTYFLLTFDINVRTQTKAEISNANLKECALSPA